MMFNDIPTLHNSLTQRALAALRPFVLLLHFHLEVSTFINLDRDHRNLHIFEFTTPCFLTMAFDRNTKQFILVRTTN